MTENKSTWLEKVLNKFVQPAAGQVADRSEYRLATGSSSGSGNLPDPGEPKGSIKKGRSVPTMFQSARPSTSSALNEADRNTINLDLTTLRTRGSTKELLALYARVNPEMSASVDAYQRLGITNYKVVAYDRLTGAISPEGTQYINSWINYNDNIGNYAEGFQTNTPLPMMLQQLGMELRYFGGCSLENILGPSRFVERIQPVGVRDLEWWPTNDGKRVVPAQNVGGDKIDLNIATFHYVSLDQSLYTAYSESPLEPALQPILMSIQFLNDVRRVIRAAVHPRLTVEVIQEKLADLVPMEARSDPDKADEWYNAVIARVTERLNGLEPQDALVYLDSMKVDLLKRGNESLSDEYKTIDSMATGKISSGAKTLPSVIGRGQSQSTASVEAMIFVKQVEGAHQNMLNMIMSRSMTQIARLAGLDVFVKFKLDPVDLRPESELASFRAQFQAMIMEQLSLGMISDERAFIALTGAPPAPGHTPLSGTGFYKASSTAADTGNPYSGTSGPGADGGGGALNENLSPKTPSAKPGDNQRK